MITDATTDPPGGLERLISFDGTAIAARAVEPREREAGVPILLCNGIGATLAFWEQTLADLARHRRVVTWDHRGLGRSGRPQSGRLAPAAHAEDAAAVLDHLGIEACDVMGWSTGGRIALEVAHRHPERVMSLALVCSGSGHTPGRLLRQLELVSTLPLLAGAAKHFSGYVGTVLRGLVARPEVAGLVRQSGLAGSATDIPALVDLLRGFAESDTKMLLALYEAVAGEGTDEILTAIDAPVLLIGGSNDRFTPLRMLHEMQRKLPVARLVVYERGTHYIPIEFPNRLAADVVRFFESHR